MRRFLLCFSVLCGIVLLLCLLPGAQRLIGSEEPAPLPEPVRASREIPALLVAGSAAGQRDWVEARQLPLSRQAAPCSQADEEKAGSQMPASFHDANGNALSGRTYRHSVYQTFILGDTMG